jgi:hypothetical protein
MSVVEVEESITFKSCLHGRIMSSRSDTAGQAHEFLCKDGFCTKVVHNDEGDRGQTKWPSGQNECTIGQVAGGPN